MGKRRGGRQNRTSFDRVFMGLSLQMQKNARSALEEGAKLVVEDAKRRVPVRYGILQNAIKWQWNRTMTQIKIRASNAKNPKTGVPYGQYVEFWPGRRKPFLYPAMDAQRDAVRQKLIDALKETDT